MKARYDRTPNYAVELEDRMDARYIKMVKLVPTWICGMRGR